MPYRTEEFKTFSPKANAYVCKKSVSNLTLSVLYLDQSSSNSAIKAPRSAAVDASNTAGSNPLILNCNLDPVNPVSSATLGNFSFKNYET